MAESGRAVMPNAMEEHVAVGQINPSKSGSTAEFRLLCGNSMQKFYDRIVPILAFNDTLCWLRLHTLSPTSLLAYLDETF